MAKLDLKLDEGPLREAVLRAYHERKGSGATAKRAMGAVRQFLSGPAGGESVPGAYWFEEDPGGSVRALVDDLEAAREGLARRLLEPLLAAIAERRRSGSDELSPNLAVYVAGLAGPLAVRSGIDEMVSGAVIAAALIGIRRLGAEPFAAELARLGG